MPVDLQLKLWLNNLTEIWRSEKKHRTGSFSVL